MNSGGSTYLYGCGDCARSAGLARTTSPEEGYAVVFPAVLEAVEKTKNH